MHRSAHHQQYSTGSRSGPLKRTAGDYLDSCNVSQGLGWEGERQRTYPPAQPVFKVVDKNTSMPEIGSICSKVTVVAIHVALAPCGKFEPCSCVVSGAGRGPV